MDGHSAMTLLQNSDVLNIEDILPLFPDFLIINDFKGEICLTLEDYSGQMNRLKREIYEAASDAETIDDDREKSRKYFLTMHLGERCVVCCRLLARRQFYIFPCQHGLHTDCLIKMVFTGVYARDDFNSRSLGKKVYFII